MPGVRCPGAVPPQHHEPALQPGERFRGPLQPRANIRVIQVVPNQIVTRELIEPRATEAGCVQPDTERDLLKLVVVERHRATGNVGVGFVRGFKLQTGALASTVAHDAHNVVVVGTNDADMVRAIEELQAMQGGLVAVAGGASARGPGAAHRRIGFRPAVEEVIQRMAELNAAARAMGCDLEVPFMTLSFLSLSPIPELKLTDQGLIDAVKMRSTSLFV